SSTVPPSSAAAIFGRAADHRNLDQLNSVRFGLRIRSRGAAGRYALPDGLPPESIRDAARPIRARFSLRPFCHARPRLDRVLNTPGRHGTSGYSDRSVRARGPRRVRHLTSPPRDGASAAPALIDARGFVRATQGLAGLAPLTRPRDRPDRSPCP